MVALDHVRQAQSTHLAATDAGVEEQEEDRRIPEWVGELPARQVDHPTDLGAAEAPLRR